MNVLKKLFIERYFSEYNDYEKEATVQISTTIHHQDSQLTHLNNEIILIMIILLFLGINISIPNSFLLHRE